MKMDDRVKRFLEKLKEGLAGLPEAEAREAVQYYEEYICDALDEGENEESVLSRLGPPEKIAAGIMAETSIRKAQSSPGLKNYSRALKYSRTLITRPFSILLFSIFIFTTYSMVLLLFLSSAVSAAAGLVALAYLVYEAVKIPSAYIGEILGTIGMGLFFAALCLLLSIAFFKLCGLFVRLSAGLVGRMLNRPGRKLRSDDASTGPELSAESCESNMDPDGPSHKKTGSSGLAVKACLAAAVAGLVLSLCTGLPVKLFTIFNSMEPASITNQKWEYAVSDVKDISITTAHSHIRLEKGNSDKIKITYEQPDWMEPEVSCSDGLLAFTEKSRGRLPLFSMVSMHENRTNVVLTLPAGFKPEALEVESRGGYIHIDAANSGVTAKTYTGSIYVASDVAAAAGIKAVTSTGVIEVNGKSAGTKAQDGDTRYEAAPQEGSRIEIETSRGSIYID
jgi:uncharacterized membrane protein